LSICHETFNQSYSTGLLHFKCAEEDEVGTGIGVDGTGLPEPELGPDEDADAGVFFTILAQDDI
jgi:hypothetical protein